MVASVSNTVYGIIADAMTDAGLLQEGDDPNSEQLASNMRRLCDIINLWQTQGLKLFLQQEVSIDLISGQSTYTVNNVGTVPTKNLRILQARVDTPQGISRPISPLSWDEWMRLSGRNTTGNILSYFVDKQATSLVVKFWNTPDATEAANTVVLLVHTQAANPYNLISDVAFPQEWRIALRWALADDIATGQPQAIMDRCQQRAITYYKMLEDWDVEDTTTRIVADIQDSAVGRFR